MDTETTPTDTTADKPITVDVPEDRVPEFYAWYAHFLARHEPGRRGPRGRRGRHGRHGHGHGRCGAHRRDETAQPATPAADA